MSTAGPSVGIVGARGHVGRELIALLAGHPHFVLSFVSSRELDGQRLADHVAGSHGDLRFRALRQEQLPQQGADAVILAMPNGKAKSCVDAFEAAGGTPILIDLSADYRFDSDWYYGLPELTRGNYCGQRRISNPGCFATAMQLAIAPMREELVGPVHCFGVSGYSGAGTTPSERNDPDKLRDNLIPYALAGHVHEREVSTRLDHPVEFMPHVASYFRGITVTVNMHLAQADSRARVMARYREFYAGEPLVRVVDAAPWVSEIGGCHHVELGGFALADDGQRLVVVATEDNLLKGAATQAMQNLNKAFGFAELLGIDAKA